MIDMDVVCNHCGGYLEGTVVYKQSCIEVVVDSCECQIQEAYRAGYDERSNEEKVA
jgi:hypothetical protein